VVNQSKQEIMEPTVWIGLGGLAATVAGSAIGFHFSQKSQRAPLRQELYKKQVEYLTEFVVQATRLQMFAAALANGTVVFEPENDVDQAWEELAEQLRDITQRAGLVLPSAAYSTLTAYRVAQNNFEDSLIAKKDLRVPLKLLAGALSKVFMVGREVLGADSLSKESIQMHSADGYKRMNQVGVSSFTKVFDALMIRKREDKSN
jgi:hypothetical protein